MASTAFSTPSALEGSLASLQLIEQTTDQVEILGALLNQDIGELGTTEDVVDVYFAIPGRPGFLTVRVGFDPNWLAQAFFQIGVKQALVRGIYDGLASKNDLPSPAPGSFNSGLTVNGVPLETIPNRPGIGGPPSPTGPGII